MRKCLLPLVLLVAGCTQAAPAQSQAAASQPAVHPVSGLPVIPLTVTPIGGRPHVFRVEVASTEAQQARGLMFRTAMGPDEGMIFPYSPPQTVSFWMKNTVIPLDLVFIGPDRRIESIAANAVPYSLTPINSKGPVSAVLELNGGRAARLGLAAGDRVSW